MRVSTGCRTVLKAAISSGEILRIRYAGGSQPGTVREIHPISLSEDECIARDITGSGEDKTFKLAKIALTPDEPITYLARAPIAMTRTSPITLLEALTFDQRTEIAHVGWDLDVADACVTLRRPTFTPKRARKQRYEVLQLRYEPVVETYFVDDRVGPGTQIESRPSQRPYHVNGHAGSATKCFQYIEPAIALLMTAVARKPQLTEPPVK